MTRQLRILPTPDREPCKACLTWPMDPQLGVCQPCAAALRAPRLVRVPAGWRRGKAA